MLTCTPRMPSPAATVGNASADCNLSSDMGRWGISRFREGSIRRGLGSRFVKGCVGKRSPYIIKVTTLEVRREVQRGRLSSLSAIAVEVPRQVDSLSGVRYDRSKETCLCAAEDDPACVPLSRTLPPSHFPVVLPPFLFFPTLHTLKARWPKPAMAIER